MIIRAKKGEQITWSVGNMLKANRLNYDYISISLGAFDFFLPLFWLFGKRCVRVWIGTDVYKCVKFWDYRIRAKLASLFCKNICVAPWLANELNKYGIKAKVEIHNEYIGILPKWIPEKN